MALSLLRRARRRAPRRGKRRGALKSGVAKENNGPWRRKAGFFFLEKKEKFLETVVENVKITETVPKIK